MTSSSAIARAGQLVFQPQPPLPSWSAANGGATEEQYKGPSDQLNDFIGQMTDSGATSVRTVSNNGVFAMVAVSWPTWQDGSSNLTTGLPEGGWSLGPGGQTQHIFKDARFAALSADEKAQLSYFRTDPTYAYDPAGSANFLEFIRVLIEQKDTQESPAVIVTRRMRVPAGWAGTVGWDNVGKVFEDNATFQAEALVPDSIILEFGATDFQWLVRPFNKEQQKDGSYQIVLSFWGAPEWDVFLFPDRV